MASAEIGQVADAQARRTCYNTINGCETASSQPRPTCTALLA
jgi:hypothetical protein